MAKWNYFTFKIRFLFGAICFCLFVVIYIGGKSLPSSSYQNVHGQESSGIDNEDKIIGNEIGNGNHLLGVIVPYRDRFEELLVFIPYLHRFLKHKEISHKFIVVNQIDTYRFNRASLINAGFVYATNTLNCDYIAMHDVDLLPLNNELPYDFPEKGTVIHVAAPGLHPKYDYKTFIGGILLVTSDVFHLVDGMSNIYWGWGLEDDEFFVRLKQSNIQVKRPTGLNTDKTNTFRHTHSPKLRPRDMTRCFDQYNKTRRRDRQTGLHNLNYTISSISHLTIDKVPLTVLNVKLNCNTQISPWCECPPSSSTGKDNKTAATENNKKIKNSAGKSKKKN